MVRKLSFDKTSTTKRAEKKSPHSPGNGAYRQCCQLFAELYGQSRRKIQPLKKEIRFHSSFHFLKEFRLKKDTIFSVRMGKYISRTFLRIKVGKHFFNFGPFSLKIGKNSAADLSGRTTFYSALFDLCSRKIGQLATLLQDRRGRAGEV